MKNAHTQNINIYDNISIRITKKTDINAYNSGAGTCIE